VKKEPTDEGYRVDSAPGDDPKIGPIGIRQLHQ